MTTPLFAAAPSATEVQRSAVISDDGLYRYRLDRWWGPESCGTGSTRMPFMMLNPSTADADIDDPTIRRCMGFARREGASGITVVNVGAYRATDPADWLAAADPYGPDNMRHVSDVVQMAGYIVAAWGANVPLAIETRWLRGLTLRGVAVLCLGTTKDGHPRHPLYVRGDQPLVPLGGDR